MLRAYLIVVSHLSHACFLRASYVSHTRLTHVGHALGDGSYLPAPERADSPAGDSNPEHVLLETLCSMDPLLPVQ